MIDQFQIPPFLLPIYQACGTQYGIPWEVLAAINKIETAFGTNLNVSSRRRPRLDAVHPLDVEVLRRRRQRRRAQGPLQPRRRDLRRGALPARRPEATRTFAAAIFAYNHADWYVDEVLLYARQYGKLPDDLVGSLTGLTEGDRFPVAAEGPLRRRHLRAPGAQALEDRRRSAGNAADVDRARPRRRRGINIYSHEGAPVVAVNDGVIKKIGHDRHAGQLHRPPGRLRQPLHLRPARPRSSKVYPVPKQQKLSAADFKLVSPKRQGPDRGRHAAPPARSPTRKQGRGSRALERARPQRRVPTNTEELRPRLFALPRAAAERRPGATSAASSTRCSASGCPGYETFKTYFGGVLHFDRETMDAAPAPRGLEGDGGHRPRPGRQDRRRWRRTCTSRSGRPAAALRRSTRSRSSTAGSCSSRPRSTAPRARTRSRRRATSARSC